MRLKRQKLWSDNLPIYGQIGCDYAAKRTCNMFMGGAQAGGNVVYNTNRVDQSAWFDGSADRLSFTPSAAGDRTRWTFAAWVQFLNDDQNVTIFGCGPNNNNNNQIYRSGSECRLGYRQENGGNISVAISSEGQRFRDTTGFYHFVVSYDSNNPSATDRCRMYANGERFPDETVAVGISNGEQSDINDTQPHYIAYDPQLGFTELYVPQAVFLDGQSIQNGDLAITNFGEFYPVGDNGIIWAPLPDADIVALADAAGGNSFCLTSAIGDGTDASANGNNFTPTSMSHSANGSSNTPSHSSEIITRLQPMTNIATLSEGGRRISGSGSGGHRGHCASTLLTRPSYWEFKVNSFGSFGGTFGLQGQNSNAADESLTFQLNYLSGKLYLDGNFNAISGDIGGTVGVGDIVMQAYDPATRKWWVGVNGTWRNSGDPAAGTGEIHQHTKADFPDGCYVGGWVGSANSVDATYAFHPDDLTYTVPTGFSPLSTVNNGRKTSDPQGVDNFFVGKVAHDGTSTNFSLPWNADIYDTLFEIKRLGSSEDWKWADTVRGLDKILVSNSSAIETTDANVISVSGTTATLGSSLANDNYLVRAWKAGLQSARETNNDGTITSTVSANAHGHFSIVLVTGDGSGSDTVGHGLPDAPELIMAKGRTGTARNWRVGSDFVGSTPWQSVLFLDANNAVAADDDFNDTAPTSAVFSIADHLNEAEDYVAYCFRSVPGLCKIGSYNGNGSTNGRFVWTEFFPRSILIKRIDSNGNWLIYDTVRSTFNEVDDQLLANSSAAETTGSEELDILSSGFKPRTADAGINASGSTYLYIAMAEVAGGGELPPIPGR